MRLPTVSPTLLFSRASGGICNSCLSRGLWLKRDKDGRTVRGEVESRA